MRARPISCCFSGHRPGKLPWGDDEGDRRCLALKERLWNEMEAAYERGYRHFICGMAQGCDLYFCELALALRQLHGDVTVEAAIPCPSQAEATANSLYFKSSTNSKTNQFPIPFVFRTCFHSTSFLLDQARQNLHILPFIYLLQPFGYNIRRDLLHAQSLTDFHSAPLVKAIFITNKSRAKTLLVNVSLILQMPNDFLHHFRSCPPL